MIEHQETALSRRSAEGLAAKPRTVSKDRVVALDVPGLLGLSRDYLNAQLGAWKGGQRCRGLVAERARQSRCGCVPFAFVTSDSVIARGKYLTVAGNCSACHSPRDAPGGSRADPGH